MEDTIEPKICTLNSSDCHICILAHKIAPTEVFYNTYAWRAIVSSVASKVNKADELTAAGYFDWLQQKIV